MGYGLDESLEEHEEIEPTDDESRAMRVLEYDCDEFFSLSQKEQTHQIWLSKKLAKAK